jgi:hypothetical protein
MMMMTMTTTTSVERIGGMLGRETEVLGKNLTQCHFVSHKSHMT